MITGIYHACLVEKCLTGFVGAPHKASFLMFFVKLIKIVVLSFKIVPAARPSGRPPVRPPSARPPSVRPPVRPPSVTVRPSVRPPGPGLAEPIYIKLPIDRHGRLLLVIWLHMAGQSHMAQDHF